MAIIPPPVLVPMNPFTEEDYQNLVAHLANIETGLKHVNLARSAGINVDEHDAKLKEARDKLLKLKNVYFPNR